MEKEYIKGESAGDLKLDLKNHSEKIVKNLAWQTISKGMY